MLNIFKSIKKIVNLGQTKKDDDSKGREVEGIDKKIDKLSGFFNHAFETVSAEYQMVREKMKDLSSSNYELGMKHLNDGNVKEAIFRFKFIKKFWPNNHDAQLQLIRCLILVDKIDESQKAIEDLVNKDPSYKDKIDQMIASGVRLETKNSPKEDSSEEDSSEEDNAEEDNTEEDNAEENNTEENRPKNNQIVNNQETSIS